MRQLERLQETLNNPPTTRKRGGAKGRNSWKVARPSTKLNRTRLNPAGEYRSHIMRELGLSHQSLTIPREPNPPKPKRTLNESLKNLYRSKQVAQTTYVYLDERFLSNLKIFLQKHKVQSSYSNITAGRQIVASESTNQKDSQ